MARDKDLDDLTANLADAQHGAFTLEQVGCDRRVAARRVGRHEWLRFAPGTFCLPGFLDEWTSMAAMCLHVPDAVVTGVDAARWWHLVGFEARPSKLLVPRSCGARSPLLRRASDLLAWEVREEPGGCLRFTDPTRTMIELGVDQPADSLERVLESALRSRATTEPRLAARATQLRRRGRRGPGEVLEALARRPVGGPADSDGEVVVLQLLRAAGVPPPVRQHRLGRWRFDLAWPELRVALELDGSGHREDGRRRMDARKQNEAVLAGWTLLRFTWDRVEHEPDAVVAEVVAALAAAVDAADLGR